MEVEEGIYASLKRIFSPLKILNSYQKNTQGVAIKKGVEGTFKDIIINFLGFTEEHNSKDFSLKQNFLPLKRQNFKKLHWDFLLTISE